MQDVDAMVEVVSSLKMRMSLLISEWLAGKKAPSGVQPGQITILMAGECINSGLAQVPAEYVVEVAMDMGLPGCGQEINI
jgi:hypothetical protein